MALEERGQRFHNAIKVKVSWKGDVKGGLSKVQGFMRSGCWLHKKQTIEVDTEAERTFGNLKAVKNWLISKIFDKLNVRHCLDQSKGSQLH